MRNLVLGIVVAMLVLGVAGSLILIMSPPPRERLPHPDAIAGAPTAGATELAGRVVELEKRLAELTEDNGRLADRVEELEIEALSLGAAVDDVQGIALRNSFDRDPMAPDGGVFAFGGDSGSQALDGIWVDPGSTGADSGGDEIAMSAEVAVDPVFDSAVRQVLSNMEVERRQERQARLELRERERFQRMGERLQLSQGQLGVVETAYLKRRASFDDVRLRLAGGEIDRDYSKEQSRAIQETYRAEISAVLTEEQTRGVLRTLDPRRGDRRGNNSRNDGARQSGQQQGGKKQGGQQQGGARQR